MPSANMGERIKNLDKGGGFLNVKNKDEKAQIRFIRSDFYYNGKHFTEQTDGKWLIEECVRINEGNPCEKCEKFFDIKKQMKETDDEQAKSDLDEQAKFYRPNVSFYYVVLDRGDGLAKVLQTTIGVRAKIDAKLNDGEKVMSYDYILKCTKKPGSEYYTLERVDSAETKELTEAEISEINEAQKWDIAEMVDGNKSSVSLSGESEDDPEKIFTKEPAPKLTSTETAKIADDIPF